MAGDYIQSIIAPDEKILVEGKLTNWVWLWPVIITALTSGLLFPVLIFPYLRQRTTELAVTDRRVIAKFGVIRRDTIEQRISKIESILVDQSLLGRMFNYGSIIVHGTGGASTPIPYIQDPISFKKAVDGMMDRYDQNGATAPAASR